MLHLIMTLLVHGAYMESAKCPDSCSCIQTLIANSPKGIFIEDFDGAIFDKGTPELKESSYKSDLNEIGIVDTTYKLKVISVNESYDVPHIKKCGKNNKDNIRDIFLHDVSVKWSKFSNNFIEKGVRKKRTIKFDLFEKTNITENPARRKNKSAMTEKPPGNKDVFTYQITCAGLRDLKSIWIRYLPAPATELNILRTNFQSFKAFQQILKESSTELSQLTVLSVSDSVINQISDKRFFDETKSANKEEMTEKRREFLPFASLQSPKLRSKSETGVFTNGKCKNLRVLYLTNSTIVYLPQDTFYSFINLQVLNLSNNLIEFIERETFSSLVNLLHLDIHNNRLRSLNEIMFKNLTKLLFLDVSQNLISNIEPSTFQYLMSLNVLILASNPLSEKQESMVLLGTGKRLHIVDISKTGLKQIPGTLERSVRVLNLMGNLLLSIRCGDLDSYSLLAYLNLRENKISYVEDDALGRLEFLKNLQIGENNLFQVPKILPNNLEILNLSYNNIQNITNLDFVNLSLLKELSLNYNQIINIEENAFINLVHLRVLDLSRNPILVLPSFYGKIKLTVLDLSYLTNIPGSYSTRYKQFPVQSPQNVNRLNLELSPVLTKIFLQDTKTLKSFSALEYLNLRFTNLTTIRKDIFSLLPKLKVLKVEGNPWHCGKEILILSTWLRNHENDKNTEDEDEVNTAHCLTPSKLYKTNLVTLKEEDFLESQMKTTHGDGKSRSKNSPEEKLANIFIKNSSEFFSVKKASVAKYNKSSANVSFLFSNNGTETLNHKNCCGNILGNVNSSRKNSAIAYLMPSKRGLPQSLNLSESTNFFIENNLVRWSNSSRNSSEKIKNLYELKSKRVSLTTLKKAEAVTAKDTFALKKEYNSQLNFLILSSIGLVVMASLTFTSFYFTRTRRGQRYQRQNQDIEVCSISSLGTELW